MATKAQKRAVGEAKALKDKDDRLKSGLEAQRADRERQRQRSEDLESEARKVNQRRRSTLLSKGFNPSTGEPFTDDEMAEMERHANTRDRRSLFERIRAGRAGTLNEQPPLGGYDDYVDPWKEMTVGEFKERMRELRINAFGDFQNFLE